VRKVRKWLNSLLGLLWFTFWGAGVGHPGPKNKEICINILALRKWFMYVYMCILFRK
jgi:hypothetical protein